jgi:hypothetical protein
MVDLKPEKKYQFKLLDFLIDQRKNFKRGRKNTIFFKLQEFPVFDNGLLDEENMEEFKKEIEELIIEEVVEVKNIETLDNIKKLDLNKLINDYQDNKEIGIKYDRRDLEELKDYLLVRKHKDKSEIKLLENLPKNFGWADVEIKFIDENKIAISVKGKHIKSGDHEDFGFAKYKDKTPNTSWELLKKLSVLLDYEHEKDKKKDWLDEKDKINNANDKLVKRKVNPTKSELKEFFQSRNPLAKKLKEETVEKHKSNLDKALRQLFSLSGITAFYDYDKYGYYRPIFTLRPYTILRDNNSEPGFDKNILNINDETFKMPEEFITSREDAFSEVDNGNEDANM